MNRTLFSFLILPLLAFGMVACSSTSELHGSNVVPAARGEVIADKGKNGNTHIDLKVKHLAPPGRILKGSTHYVIWATANGGDPQNIGSLVVNRNLEGEYKTSLPYDTFLLTVTAETDRMLSKPNGPEIFRKRIE